MSLKTTTTSSSSSTITKTTLIKGNGNAQACAACKYQRRKCAPDCILAPYFPHDRQRQFLNAHKLFGVSNITKIIKQLEHPSSKDHAMRTIIFQSDARAADPVGGCYRIIQDLNRRIELANAELQLVLHHLALCRAAHHHHAQAQAQAQHHPPSSSDLQIIVGANDDRDHDDDLALFNDDQFLHHDHDQYVNAVVDNDQNHDHVHLQDDVSSWVVQDDINKLHYPDIDGVTVSDHQDIDHHHHDVKPQLLEAHTPFHNFEPPHHHHGDFVQRGRDEAAAAMLSPVEDTRHIMLKEEDGDVQYSIQQDVNGGHGNGDDLRDAATLFTLTNCTT